MRQMYKKEGYAYLLYVVDTLYMGHKPQACGSDRILKQQKEGSF